MSLQVGTKVRVNPKFTGNAGPYKTAKGVVLEGPFKTISVVDLGGFTCTFWDSDLEEITDGAS